MDSPDNSAVVAKHSVQEEQGRYALEPLRKTIDGVGRSERLAVKFVSPAAAVDKCLKGAALKAYGSEARQAQENKMIIEFLPMVHKIVYKVVSYLHPPLSKEDLISAGTIGLVKAARDFDPSRQAEFKTYAYIRIKGSVIDELRSWSFAPAGIKKQFEQAQDVLVKMTAESGRMPSDKQLAARLGISPEKMYKMFETARAKHFLSIHGLSEDAAALGESLAAVGTVGPSERLEKEELRGQLAEAISRLNDKQRRIVILYYHKELTMKEIALVLKVTESRVSQLHASALFKLSCKLRQWNDGG